MLSESIEDKECFLCLFSGDEHSYYFGSKAEIEKIINNCLSPARGFESSKFVIYSIKEDREFHPKFTLS